MNAMFDSSSSPPLPPRLCLPVGIPLAFKIFRVAVCFLCRLQMCALLPGWPDGTPRSFPLSNDAVRSLADLDRASEGLAITLKNKVPALSPT